MDAIDIEIIRLLVRDKGGVMERRSWKSICKTLEARPTVRAKRPVQQAKVNICPRCGSELYPEGCCTSFKCDYGS